MHDELWDIRSRKGSNRVNVARTATSSAGMDMGSHSCHTPFVPNLAVRIKLQQISRREAPIESIEGLGWKGLPHSATEFDRRGVNNGHICTATDRGQQRLVWRYSGGCGTSLR